MLDQAKCSLCFLDWKLRKIRVLGKIVCFLVCSGDGKSALRPERSEKDLVMQPKT